MYFIFIFLFFIFCFRGEGKTIVHPANSCALDSLLMSRFRYFDFGVICLVQVQKKPV